MNFTREPIIETVITPREGCKLVIRSSKGANQEDYSAEAVEVISFGHSFFFRSTERPKSFLLPVSDYEIFESKETRMALKSTSNERSIKIGGGRESAMPARSASREPEEQLVARSEKPSEEAALPSMQPERSKRDRRHRTRRRRSAGPELRQEEGFATEPSSESQPVQVDMERREDVAPSFISKLFPPPPTLIKETLSRYKTSEEGITVEERASFQEGIFEHPVSESQAPLPDDGETKFEE